MRVLITLLLFCATIAAAQPLPPDTEGLRLTVRPLLCVVDRSTPSCTMSFLVLWHSDVPGRYCLHNDFDDTPLECWVEQREGELTEERIVREAFTYWMTGQDSDARLIAVTVEVLSADGNDRRRRRRGRHVWDIL